MDSKWFAQGHLVAHRISGGIGYSLFSQYYNHLSKLYAPLYSFPLEEALLQPIRMKSMPYIITMKENALKSL